MFDLDHIPCRNLLQNMFRPESRRLMPNWEHMARQHVAMFRADNAGLLKEPWILQLVEELRRSSREFAEWWSEHAVSEAQSGHKTYEHPLAGRLTFDFTNLLAADSPNLHLITYTASDEETRQRVAELKEHPCTRARRSTLWQLLRQEVAVPGSPVPR